MVIYAIFLCARLTGTCHPQEPPSVDAWGQSDPGTVYKTLDACQRQIHAIYAPHIAPNRFGDYWVYNGAFYYVCMKRRVESWREPQ